MMRGDDTQSVLAGGVMRAREFLRTRARLGAGRLRTNWPLLAQVVVGAAIAYGFCYYVLGHQYPFLAAVAAAVGTGVVADRRVHRALEYLFGATAGVLVGELMVSLFGGGVWQLAVVMAIGLTIGTLINSGGIFVTQVGIQSIYVVTVPAAIGAHPFDRTIDAVVGAGLAVVMAIVVPHDARKVPRGRASTMLGEISQLLTDCGRALAQGDRGAERAVLARARDTQTLVDQWRSSLKISEETARINARGRRHAAEVSRLARACEFADRSIRTTRIIARRSVTVATPKYRREAVGSLMVDLGVGAAKLRDALRRGESRVAAEEYLTGVARRLDPRRPEYKDLHDETLVILMRLLVVDLLQASGMTADTANEQLPKVKVGPLTGSLPLVDEERTEAGGGTAGPSSAGGGATGQPEAGGGATGEQAARGGASGQQAAGGGEAEIMPRNEKGNTEGTKADEAVPGPAERPDGGA